MSSLDRREKVDLTRSLKLKLLTYFLPFHKLFSHFDLLENSGAKNPEVVGGGRVDINKIFISLGNSKMTLSSGSS